eukprot:1541696-Rhodomonas_salina.1
MARDAHSASISRKPAASRMICGILPGGTSWPQTWRPGGSKTPSRREDTATRYPDTAVHVQNKTEVSGRYLGDE